MQKLHDEREWYMLRTSQEATVAREVKREGKDTMPEEQISQITYIN
jgi:hypothetical protein